MNQKDFAEATEQDQERLMKVHVMFMNERTRLTEKLGTVIIK